MTPTIASTCDVCGRNLVLSNGVRIVGTLVSFDVQKDSPFTKECEAIMLPYELGKEYKVCFPCVLKGLGVKPKAWANYTSKYTAIPKEDLIRKMRKAAKSMFDTPKASVPERKGPFVAEVTRILRKEIHKLSGNFNYKWTKSVILVSQRFHHETKMELCLQNEILGSDIIPSNDKSECITFKGILLAPAPWLTDYEFEIRPPV